VFVMTTMYSLTVGDWLTQGWECYKKNAKLLIAVSGIFALYDLLLICATYAPHGTLFYLLAFFLISPPLVVGWCYLNVKVVRDEPASFSDLFSGFSRFGMAWSTYIMTGLILLGGLILLIVPGIIFLLKYGLSIYAVLDRRLSAFESVSFSSRITRGYKGRLLFFVVCVFPLIIVTYVPYAFVAQQFLQGLGSTTMLLIGLIPFLANILIIVPWTSASSACAYHNLVLRYDMSEKENIAPTIP
jgi:uncharacterized membrane protein